MVLLLLLFFLPALAVKDRSVPSTEKKIKMIRGNRNMNALVMILWLFIAYFFDGRNDAGNALQVRRNDDLGSLAVSDFFQSFKALEP